MPTLERVDVINRALIRIGEEAVQFADEDDENSNELVQTYETRVPNALAVYPWRCTLRTTLLVQGSPAINWTYAHLLPANRIGMPRRVWKSATELTDNNLLKLYELGSDAEGRAAILSNEKFRGVRWVLTDGSLKIVSSNTEQEEAEETLDVAYKGDALDIGFNVNYLLDVLNNVAGSEVECRFGDAASSALLSFPSEAEFKYVVMPMRI